MKTFEQAEAMWKGELPAFPLEPVNELAQVSENIWFFNGISNMVLVETKDGLVIVDPGALAMTAGRDGTKEQDCIRKYKAV